MKRLSLADIVIDGGTQPRERLCTDAVNEYAEAMESGAKFPPLTVFSDGSSYWLADGFHRFHAARQHGSKTVSCEVHQGSLRDAILYAVGANACHGNRRTNADKRHAVMMLLEDSEWAKRSDRWIAEKCGVSPDTVNRIRREQLSDSDSCEDGQSRREGQDGKVRGLRTAPEPEPDDEPQADEWPGFPDRSDEEPDEPFNPPVKLDIKTDVERLTESVGKLIDSVNTMAARRMGHTKASRAVVASLEQVQKLIKPMDRSWRNE